VSTYKYGDLADVDLLITDAGLTVSDEAALRTAGLTLEKT
jgi:DeoR/GlpR family transcriptional regulator of sugar metabolism